MIKTIENAKLMEMSHEELFEVHYTRLTQFAKSLGINFNQLECKACAKKAGYTISKAKHGLIIKILETIHTKEVITEEESFISEAQIYWIVKNLSAKGVCYMATRLHGDLAKYNGKAYTVKLSRLLGIVASSYKYMNHLPKDVNINPDDILYTLDVMVKQRYLGRDYSVDSNTGAPIPQYFIAPKKCKEILNKYNK